MVIIITMTTTPTDEQDGTPVYAMGEDGQMHFYFWLGADGDLETVNGKAEFEQRQNEIRKEKEDWLNASSSNED